MNGYNCIEIISLLFPGDKLKSIKEMNEISNMITLLFECDNVHDSRKIILNTNSRLNNLHKYRIHITDKKKKKKEQKLNQHMK